jgi:glycosyltransferase involved in cell wall biosynthesis
MPPAASATAVIPCFNHGKFVVDAVRSCLEQTDAAVRVVVVNDGSDDGDSHTRCQTCLRLDPLRVSVLHQPNRGLPAARNAGLRHAAALGWIDPYAFFLDADDWVEPTFVSRLARELETAPDDVSHAYCQERLVDRAQGVWAVPDFDPVLLLVTNLHPVTALIRTDRLTDIGGFDETLVHGYEDWDLWLRFVSRGWRGLRVREPLFNWRRHSPSTMVTQATARHSELYRALMHRHRELFERHWPEVVARSSDLLRSANAAWIDEDHQAIPIRDLHRDVREARREQGRAQEELAAARRRIEELEADLQARDAGPPVRVTDAARKALSTLSGLIPAQRSPQRSPQHPPQHPAQPAAQPPGQ